MGCHKRNGRDETSLDSYSCPQISRWKTGLWSVTFNHSDWWGLIKRLDQSMTPKYRSLQPTGSTLTQHLFWYGPMKGEELLKLNYLHLITYSLNPPVQHVRIHKTFIIKGLQNPGGFQLDSDLCWALQLPLKSRSPQESLQMWCQHVSINRRRT